MKALKQLTLIFLIGVFLFSCSEDEKFENMDSQEAKRIVSQKFGNTTTKGAENLIDRSSAKSIAENLLFNNITSNSDNSGSQRKTSVGYKKEVEAILEVPDENNKAAYYIINYKKGGFVILAGDKRSEPILAFSETNHFELDTEYYPSGLVGWLYSSKVGIEKIRKENFKITNETSQKWNHLLRGGADVVSYKIPDPDPDCTPYTIQKGPYLQTTWGQGCGYNAQTPSMTCGGECSHAWTGCVATAMAQVMRYHQHPTSYNWANMPDNSGTTETATLMDDIGIAVNMDYKCDVSSANTKNEVASSFINDFGYSTASYANYDYQTVKSELNHSRPVILRGGRNTGWWIFGQYSDGHAWVCDGYLNYIDPCWGSILKYNMNWGWDGTYDGWYNFNDFNPGNHTFNYKTGMVYDIKP